MINFECIRWRNFLSTGQQFIEIKLNKHKTNLIVGNNGAGKSTILDALTFVLFNKPFRNINKPQLVNSINTKDTLVEIEFTVNSKKYLIRRGIKPSIFDIEVDGVVLDKFADDRESQKYLEENVLKVNYKSFIQIVILGSGNYIPFMQLTPASRREVVEDLLDIKIFSSMNVIAKERIKTLKDEIKDVEHSYDILEEREASLKSIIATLKKQESNTLGDIQKKMSLLVEETSKFEQQKDENHNKIEELRKTLDKLESYKTNLQKYETKLITIKNEIKNLTAQHKFFHSNTVCPTCSQNLEDTFRLNKMEEVQNTAKEIKIQKKSVENFIKTEQNREDLYIQTQKEIQSLLNDISQNDYGISINQKQIKDYEHQIQEFAKTSKTRNNEYVKLEKCREDMKLVQAELSTLKDKLLDYNHVYSLLKDSGVKTGVVKKYIPFINKKVNEYLKLMQFHVNFTLDDQFVETINSPIHDKFTYSSFSEGEKSRIDLALIFSWRDLAKTKNCLNSNLLFFDEVFDSSLDTFGADEFLKIIKYVVKDMNIFVISHRDGTYDKFDQVLKFQKIKGFSNVKV